MNKLTIGFVILHYNNIDDTIETVNSIKERIDIPDYHIAVVDNASPNGTGKKLQEIYHNSANTTVIVNEKNLGFSAGNNVGIEYLRSRFDIDFVVLSNNDIILHDLNFAQKTKEAFEKTKFAAMGPLILTGSGRCDANPISDVPFTREDSIKEIKHFKFLLSLEKYHLLRKFLILDYYLRKFFKRYRDKHKNVTIKSYEPGLCIKQRSNVVIHGCFIVLSREYFAHFTGLDDRTFMYSEENILYQHLKAKNLTMLYYPNIVIYHKEGASVKKMFNDNMAAMHFRFKTKIKSHEAYITLLDELNE